MAGWVCGPGGPCQMERALTPVDGAPASHKEPQASVPGLKLAAWDTSPANWGMDSRQGWAQASGLPSFLCPHKQAGPKHHLLLSEPQFPYLPKGIVMTATLASEGWGPGTKETWNKNGLSRQQRVHAAVPQLGQVGGSCPRLPTRVSNPNSTILTLQLAGGLCFS